MASFAEGNIQDSLKVYFNVEVILNRPLQKHEDEIIVSSVQVSEMRAVNFQKTSYPEVFYLTSTDKARVKEYQELWENIPNILRLGIKIYLMQV